jgi:uncharacterized metal-binding protein YceD (DUF177 family)
MTNAEKTKGKPVPKDRPQFDDAHVPDVPLWHRPVIVDRFGPRPFAMKLESEPGERDALAQAFGCVSIEVLNADLTLSRSGSRLKVEGVLHARVTQSCIVSLEPVHTVIKEAVALTFAPPSPVRGGKGRAGTETEEVIQMDVADPPEPVLDGTADLGMAMLEFFALALDPYPRKAGAEFAPMPVADDRKRPFAALAALKPKS